MDSPITLSSHTHNGLTLSPEQCAIIDAGISSPLSIMVDALAGCAKTTSIEALCAAIVRALPNVTGLALAFNVKIKDELRSRLPANFEVLTMNGLGHRAWGKSIGRGLRLEQKKIGNLIKDISKEQRIRLTSDEWSDMQRLVSLAMAAGIVPKPYEGSKPGLLPDTEESWLSVAEPAWIEASPSMLDMAHEILVRNIKMAYEGVISFDDQIYCSTMLAGPGLFPKFPLVIVDEAQDLSPLNHRQLKYCSTDRIIAVGDPHQAIYAFRGADSSSMAKIKTLRPEWIELPLETTFRCPKAIVAKANAHVPGFRAAASAPDGRVIRLTGRDDPSWTWPQIEAFAAESVSSPRTPTIAIICRNNAPLLSIAFKLIRAGIPPQMLGRDIGKGLIALVKKITPASGLESHAACVEAINVWRDRERQLALVNEKDEKLAGIEDRAESLLAVLEGANCGNANALCFALENLFGKEHGRVILGTGHKVKGLEYDTVIHLDPWRIPSKYAKKAAEAGYPAQLEQEKNLEYVIDTRSKNTLILANLEDFVV